jgi:ABC-type transport system substrate-binding protein
MVHNYLVRFDARVQLHPDLAVSWTQSRDGLTWTFKLRKGVKFHDGTPFNAEAVKYNFDRFLGPEKPLKSGLHDPIIKSVDVVDDFTVRFNLKVPFAFFLNNLAHSASGIVSPAAHKKWGKDLTLHPTGTGPFKFGSGCAATGWCSSGTTTTTRASRGWSGSSSASCARIPPACSACRPATTI